MRLAWFLTQAGFVLITAGCLIICSMALAQGLPVSDVFRGVGSMGAIAGLLFVLLQQPTALAHFFPLAHFFDSPTRKLYQIPLTRDEAGSCDFPVH